MFTVYLFISRIYKGTMVSVFGLLYIIANLKINSWDLQEKYSTQWERKKGESMILPHRDTQPISHALQRLHFACLHQVSALSNLLKQGHNRGTDTALITI